MCGRFTLTDDNRERVAAMRGVPPDQLIEEDYRPRWNIAPTDPHWIVRMRREDREARGLADQRASRDRRDASGVSQRVAAAPTMSRACRRLLEWVGPKEARQPIWFHRPDNGLFFFAGLYESWRPSPESRQRTFTILTTTATELIAPIHDRMPVIVLPDDADEWLFEGNDADAVRPLLDAVSSDYLVATAVSSRVNSVKNDDPSCLEPLT